MKIQYFYFVFLAILVFACDLADDFDKLQDPDWNPDVAIALVNSNLTIESFIDLDDPSTMLQENADMLLELIYQDSVFPISDIDLIEFPDFRFPVVDSSFVLEAPYESIQSFQASEGKLILDINNDQAEPINVTVIIPNIRLLGETFRYDMSLNINERRADTLDLQGAIFSFPDETLSLRYSATNSSNTDILLSSFFLELKNLDYSFVRGKFEQLEIDLEDGTIETDVFRNIKGGTFFFENPQINFDIVNSFGLPIRIQSNTISGISSTGEETVLESPFDDGFVLNYPLLNQVGSTASTRINVNSSNSNLSNLIFQTPSSIVYDFALTPFPEEEPVNSGFITDSSTVKMYIDILLPLKVRIEDIVILDTLDISLDDLNEDSYANMRLISENGFPLDASIQILFLDENFQVLDSLFQLNEQIIEAATVNNEDEVVDTKETISEFTIEGDRYNRVIKSENIVLRATLNTRHPTNDPVRLQSDYAVNVKLGLQSGL